MKKILFGYMLFVAALAMPVYAAIPLTGKVLDKQSGLPVSFATVVLTLPDSTLLTGTITDDSGSFSLKIATKGKYVINVSCVGYVSVSRPVSVGGNAVSLGIVYLETDDAILKTVQVTATAPLVEQKVDKLVLNVAQSAFAQGNSAFDLLRKAPGVTIDKDGNITLNGQQVAVWFDGRPSYLDGKSLEALLRSTDGTSIDKIEVMANPSAKYDAAGQGGIVNIKTKRNFAQGFNGSLSADVGGMVFDRQLELTDKITTGVFSHHVGANLNYRTDKTNTFLQLSESENPMYVNVESETHSTIGGVDFLQRTCSLFDADVPSYNLKLGSDWFIDDKNTLGFIFTMPFNRMHQWSDTNVNRSYQLVNNTIAQQVMSYSSTDFGMHQYMGNINYTHVFDAARQNELTANIDYLHNAYISDNDIVNYYLAPSMPLMWHGVFDSVNGMFRHSVYNVDVYSVKADWQSVVFGSYMMEAGGKWATSLTDNEITSTISSIVPALPPCVSTTPFDYSEHIGAVYATLAGQISPRLTAKLGLRGEYTYAFNSIGTVDQHYFDLFPTAFVGYNSPDFKKRVNFSYTRRVQRPNYQQLNPFANQIDAHTMSVGNPNLRPAYSDNFYLSAGYGQHLTVYGNFMNNKDIFGSLPQIDVVSGDQILTAYNVGTQQLYGGGITLAELPLGKPFTLMLNAVAYGINTRTSVSPSSIVLHGDASDELIEQRSFYAMAYACLTWNLPKLWKIQLDGWISSPANHGYICVNGNYLCNVSVKKTAFDSRLVLSASLNDVLRSYNGGFRFVGVDGVENHYSQAYLIQKVSVGLQWNFGAAQKPLKQRKVGNFDEAGRTGSNNSISGGSVVGQ